jgi:hypothetical protein
MRVLRNLLFLCLGLLAAGAAQAADPSPDFRRRADELVALINGGSAPEQLFSPAFLGQVPAAQVKSIAAGLTRSYGGARAVAGIEASSATSGTVILDFERATLRLQMSVAQAPPHLIESLLVTGADVKGDSVRDVAGAIAALPGNVSLAAARLGEGEPKPFLTQQPDRPLAIGSAFKLFILAELVREVKAGERRWADVVPLSRRSLPSGFLQTWPQGAPLTLHSLAALMISQSDNSAADTLLALLGREKVERWRRSGSKRRNGFGPSFRPARPSSSRRGSRRCGRAGPPPAKRSAGRCSPGISPAQASSPSIRRASRRGRSRSARSNGSPRPPTSFGLWTGFGAAATSRRSGSWRSIPASLR